ncbi:MAG: DUF1489 family protein [Rhodobacteraceae bacterium]|nr:MAG: DUF1489 family protein [Paracoccaceae bacterium]
MVGRGPLHLLKLCVGADGVEDLAEWQERQPPGALSHVTRTRPKRAAEVLDGGSLYWVFKGFVLARQRILGLEPVVGADGIARCAIVLDRSIVRTEAHPRRPFQGWRYLPAAEAPPDLSGAAETDRLPPDLGAALSALGVVRRRA